MKAFLKPHTARGHYTYQVNWSVEDNEFVGLCAEFPMLSWLSRDADEAFHGIRQLVTEVVAETQASGEMVPAALADRRR